MPRQQQEIETSEEGLAAVSDATKVLSKYGWTLPELSYLIFDASVREDADGDRELVSALCVLAQARGMGILLTA